MKKKIKKLSQTWKIDNWDSYFSLFYNCTYSKNIQNATDILHKLYSSFPMFYFFDFFFVAVGLERLYKSKYIIVYTINRLAIIINALCHECRKSENILCLQTRTIPWIRIHLVFAVNFKSASFWSFYSFS